MNKKLSGAAVDVLYALFFRGALVDGDFPSKSGATERLRQFANSLRSGSIGTTSNKPDD